MKTHQYKFKIDERNIIKVLIVVLLLTSQLIFAQSPDVLNYQAVIRNASGELMRNATIGMQISILQGATDGTAVYTEQRTLQTNNNGLVTVQIGAATQNSTKTSESNVSTVVNGDFSAIDWGNGPYFIKVETDPAGGSNYTITGISQLLSVPYALHAKDAEKITNLTYPVNEQDAATKLYVDALFDKIRDLENAIIENNMVPEVTDIDGNSYKAVKIGEQIWMAENLKATREKDGSKLFHPTRENGGHSNELDTTKAYYFYDEDTASIYGLLYTFEAAKVVCPKGWHLPTNDDWDKLENFVKNNANGRTVDELLKATSWGGNNAFGFAALPGGARRPDGRFDGERSEGYWWSNAKYDDSKSWYRSLNAGHNLEHNYDSKLSGFSVRCVRDE